MPDGSDQGMRHRGEDSGPGQALRALQPDAGPDLPLTPVHVPGHLGEFVQGRLGPAGDIALITLPCQVLFVRCSMRPGSFGLWQAPARPLDPGQVRRFLAALGAERRGRFVLHHTMPVGGGAGSSTASLVALGRAAGFRDAGMLARSCLMAEGAVDPLMHPDPAQRLWASRRAETLAFLPEPPALEIVGGFRGNGERTSAGDCRFADIGDLAAAWPAACGDAAAVAALASESARRNLVLRGPDDDPTPALAERFGALGYAAAHTGAARALLFRPGGVPDGVVGALRDAGFRQIIRFRTGRSG
jgi:hypothetical protein